MENLYRASLRFSKERLLFVDPGLEHTGWSVWESSDRTLELIGYGAISPKPEGRLADRVFWICDNLQGVIQSHKPRWGCIEQPPQTIYGQKGATMFGVIARAQSIFKLFAVTYGIASQIRPGGNDPVTFLPSHWEAGKKDRGGLEVKPWSMQTANSLIQTKMKAMSPAESVHGRPYLKTDREQNICDAITMGYRMVPKFWVAKSPLDWSRENMTENKKD